MKAYTRRCASIFLFLVFALASASDSRAENAARPWVVPEAAGIGPDSSHPGRHVTFIACYDRPGSFDADHSLRDRRAGGFNTACDPDGRRGGAVRLTGPSACVHYNSLQALDPLRGTVSLWVKADGERGLLDGRDHWLVSFRSGPGHSLLGLLVRGADGRLVFGYGDRLLAAETSLNIPLDPANAVGWRQAICSWDMERGRFWLAIDGRGAVGEIAGIPSRNLWALFVGSCCSDAGSDYPINGLVDDVVIYDLPADRCWEKSPDVAGVDLDLLRRAESSVRRFLNFWEEHQKYGGWGVMYVWPTMIPTEAQTREFMHPIGYISNDKSWSTASVAIEYLYAYRILGDRPYLDVAAATAEMYLRTIKEYGGWFPGYMTGPAGITPIYGPKIKLQDSNQSHPIFLFAALYRDTKDQRFLEAAMTGGEFYLSAQNPNGSWSHSFDLDKRIGLTASGLPQGGEINDLATSDGMDVMLMMYHLTGDGKYLDALRRAGDWLVAAQADGPTWAWAEQYDRDDNPIWARNFEPPCDCVSRSGLAVRALQMMWHLTRDAKYLAPVQKYADWVEKISTPSGSWNYYDRRTGRPVIAVNNRMFFADDPRQIEAYLRLVHLDTPHPEPDIRVNTAEIRAWLKSVRAGAPPPSQLPPTLEECRRYLDSNRAAVTELLEAQDQSGAWVRPRRASYPATWGMQTYPYDQNALQVLRYVERARMLVGDLPPTLRGDGEQLQSAFPGAGWYDTPLSRD